MIIRTRRLSKVISNSLLPVNSKGDCMYFFVHMSESSREKNLSNCSCLELSKLDILKITGMARGDKPVKFFQKEKRPIKEMALFGEGDKENLTEFIPRHLLTPALFLSKEEGGN